MDKLGNIRLRYNTNLDTGHSRDKPYLIEVQRKFLCFTWWETLHEYKNLHAANIRLELISRGKVLCDGSTIIAEAFPTPIEKQKTPDLFDRNG